MSRLERMSSVNPEWEPIPWTANDATAEEMYAGFQQRAAKLISWVPVPTLDFPEVGLLGHDREWFAKNEIAFFADCEGEDLLLIDHAWFGWPDPPRWGLVSRPQGDTDSQWSGWGHFPDLPEQWRITEPGSNA